MHIEYIDNKMEKSLSNQRNIQRFYGKLSNKIALRLSELRVASNLANISSSPPPRRHKLSNGNWGIDCSKNFRIIIEPIGNYNELDLCTIERIRIIKIEDYH